MMANETYFTHLLKALTVGQADFPSFFAPYPSIGWWRDEAGSEYEMCTAQVFIQAVRIQLHEEFSRLDLYENKRLLGVLDDIECMIEYMNSVSTTYHFEFAPNGAARGAVGPFDAGWSFLSRFAQEGLSEFGDTNDFDRDRFFSQILARESITFLREAEIDWSFGED